MARTQINKTDKHIVVITKKKLKLLTNDVIKTIDLIKLINKILQYSAIKIIANNLEPYSILNPDTNSDSPSAKSNGVRFVSAKLVIYHIIVTGINIIKIIVYVLFLILHKSIEPLIITAHSKIIDKLISYEIVWATPRNDPNKAYLEFELQPEIIIEYTFTAEMHKKYTNLNENHHLGLLKG